MPNATYRAPGASFQREPVPTNAAHLMLIKRSNNTTEILQYVDKINSFFVGLEVDYSSCDVIDTKTDQEKIRQKPTQATASVAGAAAAAGAAAVAPSTPVRQSGSPANPGKPVKTFVSKGPLLTTSPGGSLHFAFPVTTNTPNKRKMTSSRHIDISLADSDLKESADEVIDALAPPKIVKASLLMFSPENPERIKKSHLQHPSQKRKRRIRAIDFSSIEASPGSDSEDDKENEEPSGIAAVNITKAGKAVKLDQNPAARKKLKKQGSQKSTNKRGSQKSTMQKTAKEELLDYIKKTSKERDEKLQATLVELANYAFEWAHAVAHSLAPKGFKGQTVENLAATPKWINTWMIVFENIARYFNTLYPNAVTIQPTFFMLGDSNIANKVSYKIIIKQNGIEATVSGSVNVLELPNRVNLPSSSDWIQTVHVLKRLFTKEAPTHSTLVMVAPKQGEVDTAAAPTAAVAVATMTTRSGRSRRSIK